jgi:hypothetical protein
MTRRGRRDARDAANAFVLGRTLTLAAALGLLADEHQAR